MEPLLYELYAPSGGVSEEQCTLPDVITRARSEAVFIDRQGKPAAVVISPDVYEQLLVTWEENLRLDLSAETTFREHLFGWRKAGR